MCKVPPQQWFALGKLVEQTPAAWDRVTFWGR
jgi:hypothetical protein